MDRNGDTRDDEDAADASSVERMRRVYLRIEAIRGEVQTLESEEAALRSEILNEIGVANGDVLCRHGGQGQFKVIRCEGTFFHHPVNDIVYPAARIIQCAPQNKSGSFHKTQKWVSFDHPDFGTGFDRPRSESWDASHIKRPDWAHVQAAFVNGAREARGNPDACDADFLRAADGYTKRVFEEVDPTSEEALRTGSWKTPNV